MFFPAPLRDLLMHVALTDPIIHFGRVWITTHQLHKGDEHLKAAESVVEQLRVAPDRTDDDRQSDDARPGEESAGRKGKDLPPTLESSSDRENK